MANRGLSNGVIGLIVADAALVLVLIALIITHPSSGPAAPEESPVSPQATEPAEPAEQQEAEADPERQDGADDGEADDPQDGSPVEEPPEGVRNEPAFVTPSGNIWCELSADSATCTIGGHEYDIPDQPDCEGHVGRVIQVTGAEATMPCVGQSPPTSATAAHAELDYGESTMVGDFLCSSEETGVTCRSMVDGHGFALAYADYSIF